MLILINCLMIILIKSYHLSAYNVNTDNIIIYNNAELTKTENVSSNYFGYSVVFTKIDSAPILQIGAPKASSKSFHPSNKLGAVYRCKFKAHCDELELSKDPDKNKVKTNENAWIGSSMDVDLSTGRTVICGSRWSIRIKNNSRNLTIGVCYVTVNKQTLPIIPLRTTIEQLYNDLNITGSKDPIRLMKNAQGLAGFSAHFPKKSKVTELLLGAPGVLDRNGATILYKPNSKTFKRKNNKLNTDVLFDNEIINYLYEPRNSDSYIGYTVSSGSFTSTSDMLYVTGAPRTLNSKGQVGILKFPNKSPNLYIDDKKKMFLRTIDGTQVGEYFGASLAVTDLNRDGLDDLIVGSPFYTKNLDEGRVYIYLGRSKNFGDKESTYIDGNVPLGQFGSAISPLGDIDGDGFSDFVVGAPYEDDYRGAIYIYNGYRNEKGLSNRKPQRIRAIEINPFLRGFGISMAQPMDLNYDKQEDLAVGSHLSGHVVVLRTCPAATFRAELKTNSTKIKINEKKFHVSACIEYTGKNIPNKCDTSIRRYITFDTTQTSNDKDLRPKNITLSKGSSNCEEFIFLVNKDANYYKPITITMTLEFMPTKNKKSIMWIGNEGPKGSDLFTNECLVMNEQLSKLKHTIDMNIQVQCPTCECALNLNTNFLSNSEVIDNYTIGSNQPMALAIMVTNYGATAYYSKLYIKLPNQIRIAQTSCEGNNTNLECRLQDRLDTNQTQSIELFFEMDMNDRLITSKTNLTFEISITTKTDEECTNQTSSILKLISEVGMEITGKADQETYTNTEEHKINESISFEHSYEIHKFGVSPLENMFVKLFVPTEYTTIKGDNYAIAVIDEIHGSFAGKEFSCQVLNETDDTLFYNNSSSFNQSELVTNSVSEDRIFMLNCFQKLVKCSKIVCSTDSVIYSDQRIKLNLKMTLSIPLIQDKLIGKYKFIQYSTNVFVKINESTEIKLLSNESMHIATATTTFNLGLLDKISLWIIITAAVIGLVALLLLIFLLSKCGFFRREKKKQLENLIQEEKRRTMMDLESFNYEETFDVPIN